MTKWIEFYEPGGYYNGAVSPGVPTEVDDNFAAYAVGNGSAKEVEAPPPPAEAPNKVLGAAIMTHGLEHGDKKDVKDAIVDNAGKPSLPDKPEHKKGK